MSTTIKPQPPLSSFEAPTDSLLATVFRLGWQPHSVRRLVEEDWFSTTFDDRWYSEIGAAPRQLEELLEEIETLRRNVSALVRMSPSIAAESGCLLALSRFRTHLEKLWRARWSRDGRRESFYRDEWISLGPLNPVFESQEWQDFSRVSLVRLASWLVEPYASFFDLARHIGPIIFPSTKKVYDEFGGEDYRVASVEDARKARKLLWKAVEYFPANLRKEEQWNCKHMLGRLKTATTEEMRHDALAQLLYTLLYALRNSSLEKPPFRPINEVPGPFGLRAIVEPTYPYVATVLRVDKGTWPSILVKGEHARLAVELIKARGVAFNETLWGHKGPLTENDYQQVCTIRKQCFGPLDIGVKVEREVGYQLVDLAGTSTDEEESIA